VNVDMVFGEVVVGEGGLDAKPKGDVNRGVKRCGGI
jgi:hypothetical protein